MVALQLVNGTLVAGAANAALLEAFNSGTMGISWGIAGFILPYLAGIHYMLWTMGVIDTSTPVAGASSGALIAGFSCANVSEATYKQGFGAMSAFCRRTHNCQGILDAQLRQTLRSFLPPEAYKTCTNVGSLTFTQGVFPPKKGLTRGRQVGQFTSNEDLLDAALASCYIPLWSGKPYTTTFRGQPVFDGFFTNEQPCPPGVTYCVRMSSKTPAWSSKRLGEFFTLLGEAASLGSGKRAHLAMAPPDGFPPAMPLAVPNAAAFRTAADEGIDLGPGIFSDTSMSEQLWKEMVVLPGDEVLNDHMFKLGQVDAKAWATATGLADAAAAKLPARKAKAAGDAAQG